MKLGLRGSLTLALITTMGCAQGSGLSLPGADATGPGDDGEASDDAPPNITVGGGVGDDAGDGGGSTTGGVDDDDDDDDDGVDDADADSDDDSDDDSGPNPRCGDGVVDRGEACDDGNDVDTDACVACVAAVCGDGVVQAGVEVCDDGNAVNTDGCVGCVTASCGDGAVQAGVEACDDGNALNTDGCVACAVATCGDGFVQLGVEDCEDGNAVDTDACVGCLDAVCGDGFVQAGVEECDDGGVIPGDGCSAQCEGEIRPNLLQCGTSSFDVASFIPPGVDLTVVVSCVPDDDTQAMLVTRSGVALFDATELQTYVEGGGNVLTETFSSDEVYNAVFGTNVVEEASLVGSCTDRIPTVVQFSAMDPFWVDNAFVPIVLGESGCGKNAAAYPGLTPLAGWSALEVGIGYRDQMLGRVWVTEFDWQDNQVQPAGAFDNTLNLMGAMILR